MEVGYLQVYTGNGKGKTTAALGLGLRAVGNGFKVVMFQFLKGSRSGELESVTLFKDNFKIIRLAETTKFFAAMNEKEIAIIKEHLQNEMKQVRSVLAENSCDILILDEIMAAIHGSLLTIEDVCALIDARPQGMEMILTGRNAPREIIDRADLVTEMQNIKHYIDKEVKVRKGIEK